MVIKTTKRIAKKYITDFAQYLKKEKRLPIKGVYLFGSYAQGKQRNWSDIDVAIISEKFKGRVEPYEYLWLNLRDIDTQRGLEPVGFHPRDFVMENPIAAEVIMYGERIKI